MPQDSDYFYNKAKKQGYRSRASYKLLQIHEKFHIFKKNQKVVDLGASPGGWGQVALECSNGKVIGVDILPVKKMDGLIFIKGDVTSEDTKEKVKEELGNEKVDVVLSDLSPNLSGNKTPLSINFFSNKSFTKTTGKTAVIFCIEFSFSFFLEKLFIFQTIF